MTNEIGEWSISDDGIYFEVNLLEARQPKSCR